MSHHAAVAISSAIIFAGACLLTAVGALAPEAGGGTLLPFGAILAVVALVCWINSVTNLQRVVSREERNASLSHSSPGKTGTP